MARDRSTSWLDGPVLGGPSRLDLPTAGAGSLAGVGRRLGQYLVDAVASGLVAGLFTQHASTTLQTFVPLGVFAVTTVLGLALGGQTLGMRLLGMRLVTVAGHGQPALVPVVARTLLLCVLIPAVIYDADGRGLHDKAAGTVLLRT